MTKQDESSGARWVKRIAGLAGSLALLCLFIARILSRSPEKLETSKNLLGLALLLALVSALAAVVTWMSRMRNADRLTRSFSQNAAERPVEASLGATDLDADKYDDDEDNEDDEDPDGPCLDHDTPPQAGPLEERWIPLQVDAGSQAAFTTLNGDRLELPQDGPVEAAYRLEKTRRDEEEMVDFIGVETRLRDRGGRWWSARTFLDPTALTLPIRPDLAPSDSVDQVEASYWRDAPEAWREALLRGCLARDVLDLIDTRDRYRLWVSGEWAVILLKYQGPSVDVAWFEDQLLIRAKQLVLENWRVDPWSGSDVSNDDRLDIIDNVPICFILEPRFLSLFEIPDQHFASWDQCLDRYEDWSLEARRPVFEPSSSVVTRR